MANNNLCLTMKWFERTVQGFNPGSISQDRCPESGARCWTRLAGQHATSPRTPVGRHFQGGSSVARNPGLKQLGYSVRPFHGQEFPSQMSSSCLTLNPERTISD